MKIRVLSIILSLVLLASACTGSIAELTSFNVSAIDLAAIHPFESARSLCLIENTGLYILGSYGVYLWKVGDTQPSTIVDLTSAQQYQYIEQKPEDIVSAEFWLKAIRFIFSDEQSLYGLHPYSGDIVLIKDGAFQSIAQLPAELLAGKPENGPSTREIKAVAYSANKLFVLLGTDDYSDFAKTELFSFDLGTGKATICSPTNVSAITAGAEGKLALYIPGEDNVIWQYDIATDSLERPLYSLQAGETPSGLAWSSGNNALVHYSGNRVILSSAPEEAQVKAYLPVTYANAETIGACFANGLYAYPYGSCVFLRDVSIVGEATQTILRVLGYISPDLLVDFSIENPQIAVVTNADSAGEYLKQAAITADSTVDIFVLSASDNYAAIKKKGFAAPLNESPEVITMAKGLYPAVQDVIFEGDNLLAYPLAFQPKSWTVNETAWKKFGLPEYPATFDELYLLISKWLDEYAEEYPEYTLSDIQQGSLQSLILMIIREYIFQNENSETLLSFDTSTFRLLMESVADNAYLFSEDNHQWGTPLLISDYQGFGISYNDSDLMCMLLPPTLDREKAQMLNGRMEVLVVNAASQQQSAAHMFVSFCATHMDDITRYSINPNLNEPVRNSFFQSRLDTLNGELETLQNRLAVCDETGKAELVDLIAEKERTIERVMDSEWYISDESIQLYRSTAQNLRIPYASAFLSEGEGGGFPSLLDVINRHCSNGITKQDLDSFIKDLDRVAHMVYMEDQ